MDIARLMSHINTCKHGSDCDRCCWNWTAATTNGYPRTNIHCYGTVETYAHRAIWSWYHKRRVPRNRAIARTCDNLSCCNPKHLIVITRQEYKTRQRTKIRANHNYGNSKLNEYQVEAVKSMVDSGFTQLEISRHFKVSQPAISHIVRGKTWQAID